jgi:hypothetical protein
MRECKDCRHYRLFARCAAPRARGSEWTRCYIHRMFDSCCETDCGSEGRFFEPLPLDRSHGVDWDRVYQLVTSETFEFLGRSDELGLFVCRRRTWQTDSFVCSSDGVSWRGDATMWAGVRSAAADPRPRFTVAEYLAALTTDYCATRAAE